MAHVIFFEKPGCGGNAKQKALLRASGHELEVRSLLAEPWTAARLAAFFGEKPVREWFNPASPRVKSGEIKIETLGANEALDLMIAEPLLIRRPLMQVDARCESGFDPDLVDRWIGLASSPERISDTCIRTA
ncbi:ArsC/Spx/MgsR family protein [Methylocystis heyeri]|uniref:Nitrogenase-associated protein n=1 Tax=Methylocystis heyeri TaxID=391905 RepID=A0A6B8KL37_9HYPH|nr:ArsC/Spx/MgsR family protein [Methylocystis heyeri]QGM47428.1 hypothetical protein H2LOC_018000 [Methylocystis heyeri]